MAIGSTALTDQLRKDLDTLQKIRVFFAHQSVGRNILDGLASLAQHAGIGIRIEAPDQGVDGPGITQGLAGRNGHPDSKIQYFVEAMASFDGRLPRVALMKFCYVDFTPSTDIDALFQRYQEAHASCQRKYPAVAFVPVTVPLTTTPTSLRDTVKRLLGSSLRKDEANERRTVFNDRLRATFKGQPIFDLAKVESTRPDGTLEHFRGRDGTVAEALFSGYTSDGGHLNEEGCRRAAAEFVKVIVSATG
jgi:hypothetical protein